MIKSNEYKYDKNNVCITSIRIENTSREMFRNKLLNIPMNFYEVEELKDGTKILISKPGGKTSFGRTKIDDFVIFIQNPLECKIWRISYKNLFNDLKEKGKINPEETIKIMDCLERVLNGEEPEIILKTINLNNPFGYEPELILKAHKWLWGQEDVNYPEQRGYKGRLMNWEGWKKEENQWKRTEDSMVVLRERLKNIVKKQ